MKGYTYKNINCTIIEKGTALIESLPDWDLTVHSVQQGYFQCTTVDVSVSSDEKNIFTLKNPTVSNCLQSSRYASVKYDL